MIDLGSGATLDLANFEQSGLRIGIAGSSGSGKGWLLGVIVEDLIDAGLPVIMLDPEHELWTFKEAGALVVGGSEGDAPFAEDTAAIDAAIRYAITTTTPLVFDLSEVAEARESEAARLGELVMERVWTLADELRTRFAFACTEASVFAPQAVPRNTRRPEMLRQFAQRGRKRGITSVWETQRAQDIQKTVLSQANVRLIGRLDHVLDYNAVKDWLSTASGVISFEDMQWLATGEFILSGHDRIHVRDRRVTHGGGTPPPGEQHITIRQGQRRPGGIREVVAGFESARDAPPRPRTHPPKRRGHPLRRRTPGRSSASPNSKGNSLRPTPTGFSSSASNGRKSPE